MPIDIHPRRGDTPNKVQIPQNPKRIAIVTISLLSVLLFLRRYFKRKPKAPPTVRTTIFERIGTERTLKSNTPIAIDEEIEMAREKAINPTTSSKATTPKSVSTKSPFAPVCLIVINVEAGAVAEARAERIREKPKSSLRI